MKIRNLAAYFKERFPVVNTMLFAIMFLTVYSVSSYFSTSDNNNKGNIFLGVIATISFFFRLRVFDEIKDYKIDCVNHPNRVLQSGRVSINGLVILSGILTISEIIWSIGNGKRVFFFWLLALGYGFLMRYEFFIGNFLKKRLFLYASTHMIIMPFVILWIWSAYNSMVFQPALVLLASLSLLGGFCFEIARKIHAPLAERETVDSYSKSLGFIASIVTVLLFLLAGILVQCYLLQLIESRSWAYVIIGLLFLLTCIFYRAAARSKEEKKLRVSELFVCLFMLISYVSIIIEVQF